MTEHASMARLAFEHQTVNSNKNKKKLKGKEIFFSQDNIHYNIAFIV
jgi:hypothetical protein